MNAIPRSSLARLEGIVGAANVATEPARLADFAVDAVHPSAVVLPGSAEEIAEVVRLAAAEKLAVIPCGGRTKLGMGMPPRHYDLAVDLTRMNRLLAYDPGDLTLGVEAGIRFAQLNGVLAAQKQFVPLAPPFADAATIGGLMAANASTPLRHAYGSARDYVLGMEFVTGKGELAKSGGRVVKNVAGYDLHKLMLGALGTLGIITRVNFKTFPLPHAQRAFAASFAQAGEALAFCRAIARSPLRPHLVEVLDAQAAHILGAEDQLPANLWHVVVAAAGEERVVERHGGELARLAEQACAAAYVTLGDTDKSDLLGRIREFPKHVTQCSPAAALFRISILPTKMAALVARAKQIAERNALQSAVLVRASGIVFFVLLPPAQEKTALARLAQAATELLHASTSSELGGRPVIEFCPTDLKAQVNIWGPARDDLVLMQRLKKVFDPQGILCPGRYMGGI